MLLLVSHTVAFVFFITPVSAQTTGIPCVGGEDILVVQNNLPWYAAPNQDPLGAIVTELKARQRSFCMVTMQQLLFTDLSSFSQIILAAAQNPAFYNALFNLGRLQRLQSFVENGGILVANLTDNASGPDGGGAWTSGHIFLGGLEKVKSFVEDNSIIDTTSPVVTGKFGGTNGGQLIDQENFKDLDGWNWASLGYFTSLPPNTNIILSEAGDANKPVMIEYPFGQGYVIATMTTTEWRYGGGFGDSQGGKGNFPQNRKLLANELGYAYSLAHPENKVSDIVFLPGLQASRLYNFETFQNRLWEPNYNADVEKLLLTDEGKSILPNIYTLDVVDEIHVVNIYKKFLGFLDDLKSEGVIKNWTAIPYDWRYSVVDIISDGILQHDGTRKYILDEIRAKAVASPSGKVTLITHSNGGLLAKEVIRRLGDTEATKIIDQLIMVAPPQLGTPKTVTSMLHGDGQDYLKGFLTHKDTARELAEDMKSAYALLPSRAYFEKVDTNAQPLIQFDPSVDQVGFSSLRQKYGGEINTYDELKSFLTGENGVRKEPLSTDVFTPTVLKNLFITEAQTSHDTLDTWQAPEGIKVTQIVGWGLDTIRGLRYFANTSYACPSSGTPCTPFSILDHEPLFTDDGDETVVVPSASSADGEEVYYLNLFQHNRLSELQRDRKHRDILEVEEVHELINKVIQRGLNELPKYISLEKPKAKKDLTLRMYSPVKIDIYDSLGSHTGLIQNPNSSSDLMLIEEQIPNSSYYEIGEGKYVTLDTEDKYQIKLQGTAIGTFSLKIEETQNDTVIKTKEFTDIPITPITKATLTTQTVDTTSQLALDIEGDGKVDITLEENKKVDPLTNIKILQKIIQASSMNKGLKVATLAQLEAAKKLIENKNKIAARVLLTVVSAEINKAKNTGFTKQEVVQLVYMIDQIKESLK